VAVPAVLVSDVTLLAFLAGLASALLHAGWNAATRQQPDPGSAFASVVVVAGLISIPPLFVFGFPNSQALAWMAVGAAFNVLTMRLIMAAYRRTPFAVGYPMIRGTSPLGVAVIGFLLFGEHLSAFGVLGIAAISAGVFLLAFPERGGAVVDPRGLVLAIAAGLSNACFVLADARGVRASGDVLQYGFLVSIVNGILLTLLLSLEKADVLGIVRKSWRFALAAGATSSFSYFFILYAFTHGPIGPVAALRETSVFFGILLAATVLREPVGLRRWIAATLAVGGTAMIRLS